MTLRIVMRFLSVASLVAGMLNMPDDVAAQEQSTGSATFPNGPLVFDSGVRGTRDRYFPGSRFRVVPLQGLERPYAMAFLPNDRMLITERAGRLRLVNHYELDPRPIAGMPEVFDQDLKGLNDLALHPRFVENRWIYWTYYKPVEGSSQHARAALARGRYHDGYALQDVQEIFTTDTVIAGPSAAAIVFGPDDKLYLAIGVPIPAPEDTGVATTDDAQNPDSYYGKVLRLNDDGSVPEDNPFVGRPGYRPEIFALGIRNVMGLTIHPDTGEIWATDNGPQGGDEINIITAGKNYGWPVASYGRAYSGEPTGATGPSSAQPIAPAFQAPWLFWSPSISPAAIEFYTGDRFPDWKGNIFVGALAGAQLHRIVLSPTNGFPIRQQSLLIEIKQRIREVEEGPDGLLYLLTDEVNGALLRLEPVETAP